MSSELRPTVPRGRVSKRQELCLQQCKDFLVDELESEELVRHLRGKLTLSHKDEQQILGGDTQQRKNELLLNTLVMRTPEGFETFLQALYDTGHKAAHRKIKDTLYNIEDEADTLITSTDQRIESDQAAAASSEEPTADAADSGLSEGAVAMAHNLVGLLQKDKAIMDRLHKLAFTPSEAATGATSRPEVSEQHLGTLHQHMNVMEQHLANMREEIQQQDLWDEQRENQVIQLQKELQAARDEIGSLHGEIRNLRAQDAHKAQQLKEAERKNTALLSQIEQLLDHIQKLKDENTALKSQMGTMQDRMDNLEDRMNRQEMQQQQQQQLREGAQSQAMRQLGVRREGRPGVRPFKGQHPPDHDN